MAPVFKVWILVLGFGVFVSDGQPPPSNIYDALQPNGCGQFLAILNRCSDPLKEQFKQNIQYTVFAPRDEAFEVLPVSRRNALLNMDENESDNFIKSFTLGKRLLTTYFREYEREQTLSPHTTYFFLKKKAVRAGNSASGEIGVTESYANGALIVTPDIQAGYSIIHIIDRVLEIPSALSIWGYISLSTQPDTAFYQQILSKIIGKNFQWTVEPLNSQLYLTAFIPTKAALARIPRQKLNLMFSSQETLNEVASSHIVEREVIYTSFVYHNEGFKVMGDGQVIFRTSVEREAVYVNSGGVTAQITHGNITCKNGALHFVDRVLGFVYNTAMDEIEYSDQTQTFEELLENARKDLKDDIVGGGGVTLFVPINSAFSALPSFYSYRTNQTLINRVIELSMLDLGQKNSITAVNGGYEGRVLWTSLYLRRPISVYSQGNETWIESGYVKARVVQPDVAVKNGFLHFIDAVPGAPSRDVPNTIFCEDWLVKTSWQLNNTGLNDYMRDRRLSNPAPCTLGGGVRATPDVFGGKRSPSGSVCPGNCQFTIFIPNGTAIDFFERQEAGRFIKENPYRWRHILSRHITRRLIYLDQIAIGQEKWFRALNGDEVRFRRVTERYTELYYKGRWARVLRSDLGGTNGVVHIIDQVIFSSEDLELNSFPWPPGGQTSAAVRHSMPAFLLCALCSLWLMLR